MSTRRARAPCAYWTCASVHVQNRPQQHTTSPRGPTAVHTQQTPPPLRAQCFGAPLTVYCSTITHRRSTLIIQVWTALTRYSTPPTSSSGNSPRNRNRSDPQVALKQTLLCPHALTCSTARQTRLSVYCPAAVHCTCVSATVTSRQRIATIGRQLRLLNGTIFNVQLATTE